MAEILLMGVLIVVVVAILWTIFDKLTQWVTYAVILLIIAFAIASYFLINKFF